MRQRCDGWRRATGCAARLAHPGRRDHLRAQVGEARGALLRRPNNGMQRTALRTAADAERYAGMTAHAAEEDGPGANNE